MIAAGLVLASPVVPAEWRRPGNAPVDRLLRNFERRLEETPDDAHLHYLVGRVYGLAFALGAKEIAYGRKPGAGYRDGEFDEPEEVPSLALQRSRQRRARARGVEDVWTPDQRLICLRRAVEHHVRALDQADAPATWHLGLAYVLASGAHLADHLDSAALLGLEPEPPTREYLTRFEDELGGLHSESGWARKTALEFLWERPERHALLLEHYRADSDPRLQAFVADFLATLWRRRALHEYATAFRLALPVDLDTEVVPYGNREFGLPTLTAYEAGQAILSLVEEHGERLEVEEGLLEEVRAALAKLEAIPTPDFVTPVVFHLEERRALADLLAPGGTVRFDLDGDGVAERRPWVRPDTGVLVWDPAQAGTITSGRQLFGSVTWWLFFRDGFEALDALDDDRDGWLAGAELAGLAVWRDADGDAESDPGEVVGVECLGIAALSTRADTIDGLALGATRGLVLRDGRCLPTWDWVAEPFPEPEADAGRP